MEMWTNEWWPTCLNVYRPPQRPPIASPPGLYHEVTTRVQNLKHQSGVCYQSSQEH